MDREFCVMLTLGNELSLVSLSAYLENLSANDFSIVFMSMCDNVKELNNVNRKIVICEDKHGNLINQVYNISQ